MLTVDRVTVEPEPLGYESDSLLVLYFIAARCYA